MSNNKVSVVKDGRPNTTHYIYIYIYMYPYDIHMDQQHANYERTFDLLYKWTLFKDWLNLYKVLFPASSSSTTPAILPSSPPSGWLVSGFVATLPSFFTDFTSENNNVIKQHNHKWCCSGTANYAIHFQTVQQLCGTVSSAFLERPCFLHLPAKIIWHSLLYIHKWGNCMPLSESLHNYTISPSVANAKVKIY